jgi:hypothetical protein
MKHISVKELASRGLGVLGLMILLVFTSFPLLSVQEPFSYRSLRVEIFADGVATVEISLDVDTTYNSINVPIFGTPIGDVIVINHLNEPLDYNLTAGILRIITLGSYRVQIMYETESLTTEIGGGVWTFRLNSPINVTIVLPKDADVIPNRPPISIETLKEKTLIVMPPGSLELVYTITVVTLVPVPPEVPGAPEGVSARDYSDIIPSRLSLSIPAAKPTVFIFKNLLLMVDSTEGLDLELNVGSAVSMKYLKLSLRPAESLALRIDVDVSPPSGLAPPVGTVGLYINITSLPVEATLGVYINETELEVELGRDVDVSRLTWVYWDGAKWVPVNSQLDADGYLIANTTHLSVWSIVEAIRLQISAQISPDSVTQGESVTISAQVEDNVGRPVEDATVTATIGGKTVNLQHVGNGNYRLTMSTSGLGEGPHNIIVAVQKQGYEPAQSSVSLIVKAQVPYMLYGGIAAVVVVFIVILALYKLRRRS